MRNSINKITLIYFSPTGNTKKVVRYIGNEINMFLKKEIEEIDFTRVRNRELTYEFGENSLVIIGMPVYAGRIPNKLLPDVKTCFKGNGAKVIVVSTFGNRSFDNGLLELKREMENSDFDVIGAAAVSCQHAFSKVLAKGRPDESDLEQLKKFAINVLTSQQQGSVVIPGDSSIEKYYTPLKEDGTPAKFLKAKPVTDENKCVQCGICYKLCPMGSIDTEDYSKVSGVCIKCQGCVHGCPIGAKHFEDKEFLSHVRMIENNYMERKENFFAVK